MVAIPTLNEARHIGALIAQVQADPAFASADAKLWVVDGGSTDGTQAIVQDAAAKDDRVGLIENPGRTQSHAMNLAAERAAQFGARYLVRLDAHAHYPDGFVSGLIATLEGEGVESVVVPMRTIGGDAYRDAASDLYNSWLGNGGSAHRSAAYRGLVEHGHHAAFLLSAFERNGGYDVRFRANEDAEFDKRLTRSGGRIFLENRLTIDYIPRGSLEGSAKQMWGYGRFRIWTAAKHGDPLGKRQLMPIGVSLGFLGSLAMGLLWWPMVLPALAYLVLVLVLSAKAATQKTPSRIVRIASQAIVSHVSYGLGALRGFAELYLLEPGKRRTLRAPASA